MSIISQVEGEPQLLGEASVVASTGDTALLEQVLCSDPPATTTTWQWDQVVLGPGGSVDTRYRCRLGTLVEVNQAMEALCQCQLFVNCFLIIAAWQG